MRKGIQKILGLVVIAVFMTSGCAWYGNKTILKETQDSVSQKIVRGQTTKEQVRAVYGDPLKSEFNSNGDLMWTYKITKAKHDAGDAFACLFTIGIVCKSHVDEKHLVVLFDSSGVVKNYDLTISDVTFSTI